MEALHPSNVLAGMYFNGKKIIAVEVQPVWVNFYLENEPKRFEIRNTPATTVLVSYEPASQLTLKGLI